MPEICHDCGVKEGDLHKLGCDMEVCPVCGKQLICDYEHFVNPKTGKWKQYEGKAVQEFERVPYFQEQTRCIRCGRRTRPWMIDDEIWTAIVPLDWQDEVLCKKCFKWIYNMRRKAGTLLEGIKLPRRF